MASSGRQHVIEANGYEACIASVGATLRTLSHRGKDLVVPFAADEERPAMRGALLAPWPNRTADGRYEFDGVAHRLAINEPARNTASHGLVADLDFEMRQRRTHEIVLGATLEPSAGYPWRLDVEVSFSLSAAGLEHRITVGNDSPTAAPVGLGVHPYLLAGAARADAIDEWSLELPADEVMLVTPDRFLPDGVVEVGAHDGGSFDFRTRRRIGATVLNNGWTSLRRDSDGVAHVVLVDSVGSGVEMTLDRAYGWVQIYTSDEVDDDCPRAGLAVEPMTCPADAFNSKRDLTTLAPSERLVATFGLCALEPVPVG